MSLIIFTTIGVHRFLRWEGGGPKVIRRAAALPFPCVRTYVHNPERHVTAHKQAPCPPRSKAARSGATWHCHGAARCNRSSYSRPIARICDFSCVLQLSERAKRLPQKLHLNGSWPVWLRQWRFRWLLWVKDRGHMRHLYGRSASWFRRRVRHSTALPLLFMLPLVRSALPSTRDPGPTSSE